MSKFQVGDIVAMPGVPIQVEVLELSTCAEPDDCTLGTQVFRFKDPQTGQSDWMHSSEFQLVQRKETDE